MAYAGRLRRKEIPFSGFRYTKGWISQVEVYKLGREVCLCISLSKKTLKRLLEEFVVVKKSRKFPGFVMQRSKLGVPLLSG